MHQLGSSPPLLLENGWGELLQTLNHTTAEYYIFVTQFGLPCKHPICKDFP